MKITSIQGRMGLLFTAFFLLVAVSVGATFWGIDAQKKDAVVINLAGRQRMLVQQMTRLALEIEKGGSPSSVASLKEATATFEQTLNALRNGGQAPYLPDNTVEVPPTRDPQLIAQLDQVHQTWQTFHSSLAVIESAAIDDPTFKAAIQNVEILSPDLVAHADTAVRMFENASTQKITRLRWIQIGFFVSALVLLAIGGLTTRRGVLEPLKNLGKAADRIGAGDMSTRVLVSGPSEVEVLANTFESMRTQLHTSQEKLLAWANTLEERVTQRTSELEALYQVSREISSRLDVQHVLHSVTKKARELLDAEVAFLCLLDDNGKILNLQATSGPEEAVIRSSALAYGGLAAQVLGGDRALPCGVDGCMGSCGIVDERFRTSHIAAPLRMGDRVIGALCVGSPKDGVFSEDAESLLTRLANSAAIALENARLYAQAERLAVLEERQRIAADMHDGLAQTLSYAQLSVDLASNQIEDGQEDMAVETLRRVERGLGQAVGEIRRAIASLQEDFPLHFTLQEQLAELVQEFSKDNDLLVEWRSEVKAPLVLDRQEAEQVLRVVGESLLNAKRHAGAEHIKVVLDQQKHNSRVIIQDDGVGFNSDEPPAEDGRKHFGLSIMQARAGRLEGQVEVKSVLGQGTQVTLSWPRAVEELKTEG
jgi:two-component system nitrate/nitrite sensor histidine kinase NarX